MIIDAHIHIGKWSDLFFNYESTVEQAIDVMKAAGVDAALAMPADATSNSELFAETYENLTDNVISGMKIWDDGTDFVCPFCEEA